MKKNKLVSIYAFILSVTVLVSCTSSPKKDRDINNSLSPVYVTNKKSIGLLPTNAMEGSLENFQKLTGSFGIQSFSLLVYFIANEESLFLSLFNDFGTDMGNLSYNGKSVVFETNVFPKNMKSEYIILDIQNAYYKVEELKKKYDEVGLIFEVKEFDEKIVHSSNDNENPIKSIRKIKDGNKLIEEITIYENSIIIQNVLRGYKYELTGEEG